MHDTHWYTVMICMLYVLTLFSVDIFVDSPDANLLFSCSIIPSDRLLRLECPKSSKNNGIVCVLLCKNLKIEYLFYNFRAI